MSYESEPLHGSIDAATLSVHRIVAQAYFVLPFTDCLEVLRCGLFDGEAAAECGDARMWLTASATAAPGGLALIFTALSAHPTLDVAV